MHGPTSQLFLFFPSLSISLLFLHPLATTIYSSPALGSSFRMATTLVTRNRSLGFSQNEFHSSIDPSFFFKYLYEQNFTCMDIDEKQIKRSMNIFKSILNSLNTSKFFPPFHYPLNSSYESISFIWWVTHSMSFAKISKYTKNLSSCRRETYQLVHSLMDVAGCPPAASLANSCSSSAVFCFFS